MEENNRLIAEFYPDMLVDNGIGGIGGKITVGDILSVGDPYNSLSNFETDWNWLMPVVEKIEALPIPQQIYLTTEYDNRPEFIGYYWHVDLGYKPLKFFHERVPTKQQATYDACVWVINWYNENKSL